MNAPISSLPSDSSLLQEMVLELSLEWQDKVLELSAKERKWQDEKQALQNYTDLLLEQVRLLRAKRFGSSSEKTRFEHPSLFDEAEQEASKTPDPDPVVEEQGEETTIEVPAHTRHKAGRKPLPANLLREDVVHDLPEDKKVCGLDGNALVEIGLRNQRTIGHHSGPGESDPPYPNQVWVPPLPSGRQTSTYAAPANSQVVGFGRRFGLSRNLQVCRWPSSLPDGIDSATLWH